VRWETELSFEMAIWWRDVYLGIQRLQAHAAGRLSVLQQFMFYYNMHKPS